MRDLAVATPSTLIRPLVESDAPMYCALFTDKLTMRFIGPPLAHDRAMHDFQAALRAGDREPPREIFFSVRSKATNDTIGLCSIQRIDPVRQRAEVGLMLHQRAQRLGFGREIISALTRLAIDTLPVTGVWAQYAADNQAAVALFGSLGFVTMPLDSRDYPPTHVGNQIRSLYVAHPTNLAQCEGFAGCHESSKQSSQGD